MMMNHEVRYVRNFRYVRYGVRYVRVVVFPYSREKYRATALPILTRNFKAR